MTRKFSTIPRVFVDAWYNSLTSTRWSSSHSKLLGHKHLPLSLQQYRSKTTANEHYIRKFFAKYNTFDYDPTAPFLKEFARLEKQKKWTPPECRLARDELKNAMVRQFNKMYGQNEEDLESWQLLCNALGANPIPDTIERCQELLRSTHVNLVDFIEPNEPGQQVQKFESEVALSAYTRVEEKYFPRGNVNEGSLLKRLLRNIKNPSKHRGKEGYKAKSEGRRKDKGRGSGRGSG